MQQGKITQAETAIRRLYGKERVAEIMNDFNTAAQGSSEPEAGWLDLFSSRYWKGICFSSSCRITVLCLWMTGVLIHIFLMHSIFKC